VDYYNRRRIYPDQSIVYLIIKMQIFVRRAPSKYVNTNTGEPLNNRSIIQRFNDVYVPPAYTDVEYYPSGKLVATGSDADGRRQYIYTKEHKDSRHKSKSIKISHIGKVIRRLRATVRRDLEEEYSTDPKRFLAATACAMLLECNFRGGSRSHERRYGHFGITTLKRKHVAESTGGGITIEFVGKKGVINKHTIRSGHLLKAIRTILQHKKPNDSRIFATKHTSVSLADMNKYLKKWGITSKDVRTWNANELFVTHFLKHKNVKKAVEYVAKRLHNTPAVCKSSYILKHVYESAKKNKIRLI
jgi:DNA topoisomerase-1